MSDEQRGHDPSDDLGGEPPGKLEDHLTSRSTWLRLLFMIVIAILYGVSRIVVTAVVILQFIWLLLTGRTNDRLTDLGESLAVYTYQIVRYLTFNTETRPFPFDVDWPAPDELRGPADRADG